MELRISMEACRVNAGLSQVKAAELLGITQSTLSHWEGEPSCIKAKFHERIEKVYGIPIKNIDFTKKSIIRRASETFE